MRGTYYIRKVGPVGGQYFISIPPTPRGSPVKRAKRRCVKKCEGHCQGRKPSGKSVERCVGHWGGKPGGKCAKQEVHKSSARGKCACQSPRQERPSGSASVIDEGGPVSGTVVTCERCNRHMNIRALGFESLQDLTKSKFFFAIRT